MRIAFVGSVVLIAAIAFSGAAAFSGATVFSGAAQVRQKKVSAPPKRAVEENWRLWGGPQRDFLTTSTGLFKAGSDKWMPNPPKKIWERPLGDGYSAIAVENGILYTSYRRDANDVPLCAKRAHASIGPWAYRSATEDDIG